MATLRGIVEALFWLLMAVLLIGMVMLMFGRGMAPLTGYLGAFALLSISPLVILMMAAVRRRRAAAVIAYLDQAVRLNLPLPRMIAAAQHSEQGVLSQRLAALSAQLRTGKPVGDCVAASVPEIDAAAVAALEAGESIGRLPHALSRLIRQRTARLPSDTTEAAFYRAYPFMMGIIITIVVTRICIFVVPKFETIFADFGLKLPPVTQAMLDTARTFADLGVPLACGVIAILLAWAATGSWRRWHPRSEPWNFLHRRRDQLLWKLPLTHGLVRDRGLGEALDLMSQAVRAGHPFDRAAEEASWLRVNDVLQRRLADWTTYLRNGASLYEAAQAARLPDLIVEMLAPIRGGEQAADVLTFLARYYDARFSRARLLLHAASVPLIVFLFAAIVAFVALSLMMPLTTLIDHLSRQAFQWRL